MNNQSGKTVQEALELHPQRHTKVERKEQPLKRQMPSDLHTVTRDTTHIHHALTHNNDKFKNSET